MGLVEAVVVIVLPMVEVKDDVLAMDERYVFPRSLGFASFLRSFSLLSSFFVVSKVCLIK